MLLAEAFVFVVQLGILECLIIALVVAAIIYALRHRQGDGE
jgi:hypothetical protein